MYKFTTILILRTFLLLPFAGGEQQQQQLCDSGNGVSDYRLRKNDPDLSRFAANSNSNSNSFYADFSPMLFDLEHNQLIVGAKDAVFRLSLDLRSQLQVAKWEATEDKMRSCLYKGQTKQNCRNFVKIILKRNDEIFVCGTFAFSPSCSWRKIEDLSDVTASIDGRGKCPTDPEANSTALMTEEGDFYIASSIDFTSNDYAVYRMSSAPDFKGLFLKSDRFNPFWLNSPDFVLTFETEEFVYFIFR